MRKEAIGIAINGREVKIAHVFRDKYRLGVDFLESSTFITDIDADLKKKEKPRPETSVIEEDDVFSVKSNIDTKSPIEKETGARENTDILYTLLSKFSSKKVKVAFNISPARVTYQNLDTQLDYNKNVFKGILKKKIDGWKKGFNDLDNVSVITRKDGSLCNVFCETYQPPIVDILENLNTYFKGNLQLTLMDSNDVALINLARISYDFSNPNEITTIIEIETEFSRIIFMKGEDLLMVPPIINEGFNPDIINIVYRKIIYELDNSNIPDVSNILLAGRASSMTAKSFFEQKFPKARVGFIMSQPLAENLSTQFSREDLSNYAIPISLAWKTVEKKSDNFIPTNLLPTQIIDRQKMLSLNLAGYILLILLGITAFALTWKIAVKKLDVADLRRQNNSLQEQIYNSESTVNRVHQIEDEIDKLTQRVVLSDSLSLGSDRLINFLENLNRCVSKIRSLWIEEVSNTKTGVLIKGMSLKRGDVPRISEELGGTKIKKLTRTGSKSRRVYYFEMEIDWSTQPPQPGTDKLFKPRPKVKPLRTASTQSHPMKSSSTPWGTKTTATQTIVAEQDANEDENVVYIPSDRAKNNVALNNEQKMDRLSDFETASNYSQDSNKHKIGSKYKTESQEPESSVEFAGQNDVIQDTKYENHSANDSHYTIQISAYANKFTARKEVERYRSKGFDAFITTLQSSSRDVPYWVCLGDFPNYDDAQQELVKLNRKIPGKRMIIEVSEDRIHNGISSALSYNSGQHIALERKRNNNLIKKANHTIASNYDDYQENLPSDQYGSGSYSIRISAHVIQFTAQKEVEYFRKKGYTTYITKLPNSSRDAPYSVCYGNFNSYQEAQQKARELNRKIPRGYDIITLRK